MRALGVGIGLAYPPRGEGSAIDKTPAAFTFTDQTGVALNSVRTSNSITVTGTNESTPVTITGGTYSKNGAAYTSAAGTAFPGDSFTVRHTASASERTATNTVLTIGGVSDTFTSTTTFALVDLSLDDLTIAEDQPAGTKVGTITGGSAGSTITLHAQSNAGMFAKDGGDIEVGATPLDFETVPSPTITTREIHSDASNSPHDTVIAITVTDVAEGPSNLFPDPNILTEANYTLSGPVTWQSGALVFDDEFDDVALATFAGAAAAAMSALDPSTPYQMILTFTDYVGGTFDAMLRGFGPSVEYSPAGDGPISHTVTTDTGTVSRIGSGFVPQLKITKIEVYAI